MKDKILELFEEYWKKYPDLRFCQIIGNIFGTGDHYYKSDEELLDGLEALMEGRDLESRPPNTVEILKKGRISDYHSDLISKEDIVEYLDNKQGWEKKKEAGSIVAYSFNGLRMIVRTDRNSWNDKVSDDIRRIAAAESRYTLEVWSDSYEQTY